MWKKIAVTKWEVRGEMTSRRQVFVRTAVMTLGIIVVADGVDVIANLFFAPEQLIRSAIQTTLIAGVLGAYVVYTHAQANLKLYEMKTYLAKLSYMDSLTELLNRRAFIEIATGVAQAPEPHVLMLVDIDAFKAVNDQYGHPIGDGVIAGVAGILRDMFAPQGSTARLGGEEFAALLDPSTPGEALTVATQFCERVNKRIFEAGQARFSVMVSVGLAAFSPGLSFEEVYSRADRAMYASKKRGGNQVSVFEHDPSLLPVL